MAGKAASQSRKDGNIQSAWMCASTRSNCAWLCLRMGGAVVVAARARFVGIAPQVDAGVLARVACLPRFAVLGAQALDAAPRRAVALGAFVRAVPVRRALRTDPGRWVADGARAAARA